MEVVVKVNPMTYVVDFIKRIVLDVGKLGAELKQAMGLNLKIFDHSISATNELVLLIIFRSLIHVPFRMEL